MLAHLQWCPQQHRRGHLCTSAQSPGICNPLPRPLQAAAAHRLHQLITKFQSLRHNFQGLRHKGEHNSIHCTLDNVSHSHKRQNRLPVWLQHAARTGDKALASSLRKAVFFGPDVATTYAPKCTLASCTANVPTPPAPACTSTLAPFGSFADSSAWKMQQYSTQNPAAPSMTRGRWRAADKYCDCADVIPRHLHLLMYPQADSNI